MPLLQELLRTQEEQIRISAINNRQMVGLPAGAAYAQYFPTWEVTAPQYQQPNAYTLTGFYRTNEVAYACIDLRMKTLAEPPARVYDKVKKEFIEDHPFYELMEEPCPGLSQSDFLSAVEMYLCIAGAMAWEKNYKNNGKLKNIWPMMPQYCSYLRGEGKLLRAIRYQPYSGLPYLDIDREKIVFFSYVDPRYFGLTPLSPTAVLADVIGVDNDMTKMLEQFINNGAFVSGLLTTEQIIGPEDANFARERFKESHGGVNNAGDVVVLGKGMKFERMGQTFREMVFPEVDARSEARICMGYGVKPILVSAKIGMDRSTYNNYKEARQAWYEENVTNEWKFIAECLTRDLLREFDEDKNHIIKFDVSEVKALQEDRNAMWKRSDEAFKSRIITRNDALKEKGLQPLPEGDPLGMEYYEVAMTQTSMSTQDDLDKPNTEEKPKSELEVTGQNLVKLEKTSEAEEEEKHFRAFAKRRLKEGKPNDIGEFEFKFVTAKRQRQLLNEFGVSDPDAKMVLDALLLVVKSINRPQDISVKATFPELPVPVVNIENVIPEQKTEKPNITINVEPTPIQNTVEVKTPKMKSSTTVKKIKRDGGNNLDGTIDKTDYEYEE